MTVAKKLLLLTLPTLLLLAVAGELVFRFVIPAAEWPYATFDRENRLLKYDTSGPRDGVLTVGPFAEARAHWHVNDEGWSSPIDYVRPHGALPRIAIIGDSYIEAFHVEQDRSVGALVRRGLAGRAEVYTFGMSGAPLSQYLNMARYAARRYAPDVFVINVVQNDFAESVANVARIPEFLQVEVEGDAVSEVPARGYTVSAGRRLVRHSAMFRWLVRNAKIRHVPSALGRQDVAANIDVGVAEAHRREIDRAVRYVVSRLRAENPRAEILFVMDAPRDAMYAGTPSRVRWLTDLLRDAAGSNGCRFLDLTPAFTADWARAHQRLEFANDWHWNERAHRIVSEQILAALRR
jgi:hypothetical protein